MTSTMQPAVSQAQTPDYESLWHQSRLSVLNVPEKDPEVLKVEDTSICTLGNFSASIGKAKSKKTFNLSAIVAAALKGDEVVNYTGCFPEGKRKVLYVDTEQSDHHCSKVYRRILKLAGLSDDEDNENLEFLALRKFTPAIRLGIIETAIYNIEGLGLVIIDGIRDLVVDINSPSEATFVISKLMQWTEERLIHLHAILHQNKGDDNARGHIGTELLNKAETVLQVERDKDDHSISKVEAVCIRGQEFAPFAFRINDEQLPELIAGYSFDSKSSGRPKKENSDPYMDIPVPVHQKVVDQIFQDSATEFGYKQLQEALKAAYANEGYSMGDNKIVDIIKSITNKRIIIKNERNKNILNPERHW